MALPVLIWMDSMDSRIAIVGQNGTGKSTLMRQLRDGKVENFPPQDQLRCVMVEHSLQGENTSLSVLDFVASGKPLGRNVLGRNRG